MVCSFIIRIWVKLIILRIQDMFRDNVCYGNKCDKMECELRIFFKVNIRKI